MLSSLQLSLGNAAVTVTAIKHVSSGFCAGTWLAAYMQRPESGTFFTGDDECSSAPTELAMSFTGAWIWPGVVPKLCRVTRLSNIPTILYARGHFENINYVEVSCLLSASGFLLTPKVLDGPQHLGQAVSGTQTGGSFYIQELEQG